MTATHFFAPRSLDEAIGLLHEHGPDLTVLGGGTIVMGLVNEGLLFPKKVMSLARAGMDSVQQVNGHVMIGAGATLARLSALDSIPILADAAGQVGGPAVRNAATVGGNLFAGPPYGDLAMPLLALGASVELAGSGGRRTIALEAFFAERRQAPASRAALLTTITVSRPHGRTAYLKLGRRQVNAASVVAVAVQVVTGNDGVCTAARIALGAAAPYPMRAIRSEAALLGRQIDGPAIADAAEAAAAECDPFTDALASAWYRRRMVGVFVRRALEQAMGMPGQNGA